MKRCYHCSQYTVEAVRDLDNNPYCEDCADQRLVSCHNCGGSLDIDDANEYCGDYWCEACFSDDFVYCECCENPVPRQEAWSGNYWVYCCDCYNDLFVECSNCGEAIDRDAARYSESDDDYYCQYCYERAAIGLDSYQTFADEPEQSPSFNINKSRRLVGVEIECVRRDDRIVDYWGWSEVGDTSLPSNGMEYHLCRPMNGDMLLDSIKGLCNLLQINDYYIVKRCGLHIHIDARDLDWDSLKGILALTKIYEKSIFSMLPPSRQNSQWCARVEVPMRAILNIESEKDLTDLWYEGYSKSLAKYNDSRYHGLNLHARYYMGTIEFRYHSGTISARKIINWIKICLAIVETGVKVGERLAENNWRGKLMKKIKNNVELDINEFISLLGLRSIREYIENRFNKFNPHKRIPTTNRSDLRYTGEPNSHTTTGASM